MIKFFFEIFNISFKKKLWFKGFYTQIWSSNPRLCNFLQIAQKIQVSIPGASDLFNNYAITEERLTRVSQHGASKSGQT